MISTLPPHSELFNPLVLLTPSLPLISRLLSTYSHRPALRSGGI